MDFVQVIAQNVKHFQDVKSAILGTNYIEGHVLIAVQFIQIH